MEIPEMTKKLNAAEPTIVDGPNSPAFCPRVETVSMTLRRISGALEPKAISVKLATVGFQTFTFVFTNSYRYGSYFITTLFEDVMTSIALKISKTVLIDL